MQKAIETGELDADRLKRFQKLEREEMYNNETIAEARARTRGFAKMVKNTQTMRKALKGHEHKP